MKKLTNIEIRKKFLEYFENKRHRIIPSSSLVPDDPTMLLTTAGMVQFKPYFSGESKASYKRAASCQKCLRTTDIENVGYTNRHHTFFEMLGNFSFGDYYKKEAITWAWDFLVNKLRIDQNKLWITIYEDDDEAYSLWLTIPGVKRDRIVRMSEEDNFWSSGPVGPCGPCSEIVYDFGPGYGCGKSTCRVGCECDRYLEVWNLVFMEYDRDESGKLNPLPKKNIDTGMGLERLATILRGVTSNYETDLFYPIIKRISKIARVEYGQTKRIDISIRVMADHIRAIIFMLADGVIPSNEGRGYVLRRLLRRTIWHGHLLGIRDAFLTKICPEVFDLMGQIYPEIEENKEYILRIINREEEHFSYTLNQGLSLLKRYMAEARSKNIKEITGEEAFVLHDTFGFPVELTKEIAQRDNFTLDERGFSQYMEKQKELARQKQKAIKKLYDEKVYRDVINKFRKTNFTGYQKIEDQSFIQSIIHQKSLIKILKKEKVGEVILKETPFYAEMGGQIHDQGLIQTKTGEFEVNSVYCLAPEIIVHKGRVKKGEIRVRQKANLIIDAMRRKNICRHHTATHLLHWALRQVLGEHVRQAGSLVAPDRLRFDFTHFELLSPSQLERVERLVNRKIMENEVVGCYTTTMDYARNIGAVALFGEKYGDYVRVVEIGDFSKELCGGTHLSRTSELGLFKLVSESGIGANLRRIEALTGPRALDFLKEEEAYLNKIGKILGVGEKEIIPRLENMLAELKSKTEELEGYRLKIIKEEAEQILSCLKEIKGEKVLISEVRADSIESIRIMTDLIKKKIPESIIILGANINSRAALIAKVSPELISKGLRADEIINIAGKIVGGGGGGQAHQAQAGGKNAKKIPEALNEVEKIIRKKLR